MKKYVIGKYKYYELFNKWFNECERLQIPYVIVRNKRKYSYIEWDFIMFNGNEPDILRKYEKKLLEMNKNIFAKYASKKSGYSLNCHIAVFQNIPIENSNKLAEALYNNIINILKEKP